MRPHRRDGDPSRVRGGRAVTGGAVRPGLTSCLRLGGGTLTLQTEIVGSPPEIVTTVDYDGRTIRVFRGGLAAGEHPSVEAAARAFHRSIEARLRARVDRVVASTEAATPAPPADTSRAATGTSSVEVGSTAAGEGRPSDGDAGPAVAALFVDALRALYEGRGAEALRLLAVVDLLLPDDPRPRALAEAVRRGGFDAS